MEDEEQVGDQLCRVLVLPRLSAASSLLGVEMRAKLPQLVALCPQHAPEFYYPLKDGESLTCPQCSLEMVVYEKAGC